MTLYYNAPTKYYKYVYSPYTLPKMTSQTAPEGKVGTNFVFGTHSKDLYSLFWNTTGWYIDISANTSGIRYINYKFKNPLPPGTYTLSCKMKTQNNVTSTGYHWDIICDNGSGGNEYITIGNPGTPPKTDENTWPAGSSYSWTFTSTKRIRAIELKINSPSVSSSSYICLFIDNLNLTCEGGLKIQTGTVEVTSSDYDYSVPNLFKIRDYDTTGVYCGENKIVNNVSVVGSPAINGHLVNGFSTSNYLKLPNAFDVSKNFEIIMKFSVAESSSEYQTMIAVANQFYVGLRKINNAYHFMCSINNGSAWTNPTTFGNSLTVGSWYWFKVVKNGTTYTAYHAVDTANWIQDTQINASINTSVSTIPTIGIRSDLCQVNNGIVDLADCSISVNGTTVWKGIKQATISKPIGFIYQNGKLLYKGRHYQAWSVPSGALSKGYSATGEASGSIGNLFDKNHNNRWGQGVEGNRKWFRLTLPYPVIVDAITVIQGFAGSHDDSRIYNVTFYAELTGANSTGGQIKISNKQSLNWTVASSTAITITNKPICKRIYCWTEGQAYSTLGEVYISGRRVL